MPAPAPPAIGGAGRRVATGEPPGSDLPGSGGNAGGGGGSGSGLAELAGSGELDAMRRQVAAMEAKLSQLRTQSDASASVAAAVAAAGPGASPLAQARLAARLSADARSVAVGGVPPSATEAVLAEHFGVCGVVMRATVLRNNVRARGALAWCRSGWGWAWWCGAPW